jgi:hypothetical protein
MNFRTVITLTTVAIMIASIGFANEFKPSRSDVEDYCTKSGKVFIKASIKAKSASASSVQEFISKEIKRTRFVNSIFNSESMKQFTAEKLNEDVAGAQQEINSYMDKGGTETFLVKSFSDGCVKGFFKESNK